MKTTQNFETLSLNSVISSISAITSSAPGSLLTPSRTLKFGPRASRGGDTFQGAVDSIREILSLNLSADFEVKKNSKLKGATFCKGMVEVLPKNKEEFDMEGVGNSSKKASTPMVRYAFYPSSNNPEKLGSVAIYAPNVTAFLSDLRRTKSFFGHKVKNVTLECGRRPFLDVTLVA